MWERIKYNGKDGEGLSNFFYKFKFYNILNTYAMYFNSQIIFKNLDFEAKKILTICEKAVRKMVNRWRFLNL